MSRGSGRRIARFSRFDFSSTFGAEPLAFWYSGESRGEAVQVIWVLALVLMEVKAVRLNIPADNSVSGEQYLFTFEKGGAVVAVISFFTNHAFLHCLDFWISLKFTQLIVGSGQEKRGMSASSNAI